MKRIGKPAAGGQCFCNRAVLAAQMVEQAHVPAIERRHVFVEAIQAQGVGHVCVERCAENSDCQQDGQSREQMLRLDQDGTLE